MRLRNIPGADAAITESVYCIKSPETHKGHWQEIFPSQQPLHIEIGMGKGRFMMDLAAAHPDINYVAEVFDHGEVDRIYLNFSDPWPKDRHAKRRLTSRQFFARYDEVLAPEGRLEFKTDNQDLFTFSLEEIPEAGWHLDASTRDLHHDPVLNEGNIMTEYEEKFSSLGNPICKLIASR